MKPSFALIGPGKVGCAVSRRLYSAGYPLKAVIGRDLNRAADACRFIGCAAQLAGIGLQDAATADILLLAIPDDQIQGLALAIQQQKKLSKRTALVHFSGSQQADLMRHDASDAQLLSLHPLLPFASRERASEQLPDCPCAVEGDPDALVLGEELVRAFGGKPFRIPPDSKPLYHTAACLSSNYLVTLLDCATELFMQCGIAKQEAILLLQPLLRATLDNCATLGTEQGLTGPIVRGDCGTVRTHLTNLENLAPELLDLYRLLGGKTLALAKRSGRFSAEQAAPLDKLLD